MTNKVTINGSNAFGFYTEEQVRKIDPSAAKSRAQSINVSKILGYIPIVNCLRWDNPPSDRPDADTFPRARQTVAYRTFFILRLAAEMFQVGILFLIPDLLFTMGRNCQRSKAADLASRNIQQVTA